MKMLCLFLMCIGSLGANEKIYLDIDDVVPEEQTFHIPEGGNVWLMSNVIRSENRGFYIYESDIITSPQGYEKMWRCPYCNNYWPIGQKCQNPSCPSKY